MKKTITILLALSFITATLAGCDNVSEGSGEFDAQKEITVVSREQGSGTRGAFVELLDVEVKNDDGTKQDKTTDKAIIQNNTEGVISQISGNETAIGYISLGSLNDTVSALKIDGVSATAENVKNGTYKVSRPFITITKGDISEATKDFNNYIMSKEGQEIVSKSYIAVKDNATSFVSNNSSGKVVIGGSSSVSPVIEKIIESYQKVNPNVNIELQTTDSGSGIKNVGSSYDIGMSSRELKDTEKEGKIATNIALDGIAIIINKANIYTELSANAITKIYTGELNIWNELG